MYTDANGLAPAKIAVPETWAYFEVKHLNKGMHYQWHMLNVFTLWIQSSKQTIVLVFDAQLPVITRIPKLLLGPNLDHLGNPDVNHLEDPFWAYTQIAGEVVRLEDTAVWAIRDHVRAVELERKPSGRPQPDYRRLHDIARHAIHVSESLDVAAQTMRHMITQHEELTKSIVPKDIAQNVRSRLHMFESFIGSLQRRSTSNEKRMLNEIQLTFNTVAQHDASTSVDIGRAAQSDSAAMKTIAFVTLTFIPPTFISAIFSMSFFDFSPDSGWTVSSHFWVYWASAVPTTLLTILLWLYWQNISKRGQIGEDRRFAFAAAKPGLLGTFDKLTGRRGLNPY